MPSEDDEIHEDIAGFRGQDFGPKCLVVRETPDGMVFKVSPPEPMIPFFPRKGPYYIVPSLADPAGTYSTKREVS